MGNTISKMPKRRKLAISALQMATKRSIVDGILEADITEVWSRIRKLRCDDGSRVSFTAYIIACYASALMDHPVLRTYQLFPNRLLTFDGVDVSTLIDHPKADGIPVPYLIKNAHIKSVQQISIELRAAVE